MIPEKYPWRIVVAAAISIAGNIFLGYYLLFGLATGGIALEDRSGHVLVTEVVDDHPADHAGFRSGDEVLSVNGQPIGNVADWFAARMNFAADRPALIRIRRAGQEMGFTLVLDGRVWEELS